MKSCFLLAAGLLAATPVLAQSTADALWSEAEAAQKAERPRAERVGDKSIITPEFIRAMEARNQKIGDLLLSFVEGHPADARRPEAIVALARNGRMIVKEIGDVREKGWEAVVRDPAAEAAWNARVGTLLEQVLTAPGVEDTTRQAAYEQWTDAARAAIPHGGPVAEFRRRLDVLRSKYPKSNGISIGEWQYLNRLRRSEPAAVASWLKTVAAWPDERLAKWAQGELAVEALRHTPMEMTFTALDGREVDLARLRGKVVLIDFWATWCGPCIAELPNVKKVYEAYHAKGFEVIAITLDAEKDKEKLIKMCADKGLPWPQHFDGLGGKNKYAEMYSVMAIPSMFLLDKSGRLVSTDARGAKLEEDVKKYLAL